MTDMQWQTLLSVIRREPLSPLPVGFIIDCPWLPNWYGSSILDYFTNDEIWLNANLKAVRDFPDVGEQVREEPTTVLSFCSAHRVTRRSTGSSREPSTRC